MGDPNNNVLRTRTDTLVERSMAASESLEVAVDRCEG